MICRNRMAVFAIIAVIMYTVFGITGVFAAQAKRTIVVSKFENRSNYVSRIDIGHYMADQLTDVLMSSGIFVVVDQQELGNETSEQGDPAADGRAAQPKTGQTGKLVPAQVLIEGTITQFDVQKNSRRVDDNYNANSRGSPWQSSSGVGVFSRPGGESYTAHVAITLHIIDIESGEDLHTLKVKGETTARSIKRVDLGARGFERTPLGRALQKTIKKAVTKIAGKLRK